MQLQIHHFANTALINMPSLKGDSDQSIFIYKHATSVQHIMNHNQGSKGVRITRRMHYFIKHRNVMNKIFQKHVCRRILMFHVRRPQICSKQRPLFSFELLWCFSKQRQAEKPCELMNSVSKPAKLGRTCGNATNAVGRVHHMFRKLLSPPSFISQETSTFHV